jgi:long-chain acyl-CoA synthetase
MADRTVLDCYRHEVEQPLADKYTHYRPDGSRTLSTEELFRRTAAFAEGLASLGVKRGDRVILLSDNRPEWHLADLAVLSLGARDGPLYPTLIPPQIAFQARDSGSKVAIVENPEQAAKFHPIRERCPDLEHIVQIEGEAAGDVRSLEEVLASGDRTDAGDRFWDRAATLDEHEVITIIYTSGTTGEPKGVMLTHHNLVSNGRAVLQRLPVIESDEVLLEFLPLCHVFERCAGYAYMTRQHRRAYCAMGHLGQLIGTIRPHRFCSAPRVFEKVHQAVLTKVQAAPPLRRRIVFWALEVGREMARHRLDGTSPGTALAFRHALADRLALRKVRAATGGRLHATISGAAPLAPQVNEFFHAVGIPIQEAYGLTETSPGVAVSGYLPGENRFGAVGRPLEGVEVGLAPDGELLVRGPNVMKGYWNRPEATAEAIDPDGFFHTGDIASIDEDGFVRITDRKKDLIVTSGGKNVAPQPIENRLKQSCYVDVAVLVGDRRPFIAALIGPAFEALEPWARERGVRFATREELVELAEVRALYASVVDAVNDSLARYEQIRKFIVVPIVFTVESGYLTSTLKVKRRVVEAELAASIEALYAVQEPARTPVEA